jgi:hypothetical protein
MLGDLGDLFRDFRVAGFDDEVFAAVLGRLNRSDGEGDDERRDSECEPDQNRVGESNVTSRCEIQRGFSKSEIDVEVALSKFDARPALLVVSGFRATSCVDLDVKSAIST